VLVSRSRNWIGLQSEGQYGKAAPLYERSLAIFEKALGPHHPDMAALLHNYALLLQAAAVRWKLPRGPFGPKQLANFRGFRSSRRRSEHQ
jgi:hypothetical protein